MDRAARTTRGMTLWSDGHALLYISGMAVDGDGSPHCYHPNNSGLDYNANAFDKSRNKWVGVVVDSKGDPVVQGSGQPAPGYYVSPTSLHDPKYSDSGDARRYVDAEKVPYIAFPSALLHIDSDKEIKRLELGVNLGDYAIVYHLRSGRMCSAIFADVGPRYKLGEASIRVAAELGLRTSPKNGGTEMSEIAYLIFPRSFDPWPQSADAIQARAGKLLAGWGGLARLQELAHPRMPTQKNGEPMHAVDMPAPGELRDRSEHHDPPGSSS